MEMPSYAIRGQTLLERRQIADGGEPVKRIDKYHLVDLKKTDDLSICGLVVDPTCSLPFERWATLEKCCDECRDKAGDAPRKQAERATSQPIDWDYLQ